MFEARHGKHVRSVPTTANYNGLSFARVCCEKKRGTLLALSECRQTLRKNLIVAVKSVIEALEAGADIEYHLIGTASQHESLKQRVATSRYADKIFAHGRLGDQEVAKYYRDAHVFIHPQRELLDENDMEGFGLVIADGMAKGCIPIIGDNGGARELVENGVNGFMVGPFDKRAITAHLVNLPEHWGLGTRLSEIASSSALRFSWVKHVQNGISATSTRLRKRLHLASHIAKGVS
jgi:phosphatidylinositol alpha-1,6-mannosyltransferase